MRLLTARQLFMVVTMSLFMSVKATDAAVIRSASVQATPTMREAWLAQNQARNLATWQRLAGRNKGISAASLKTGPTSLADVWAVYRRSMRYGSQLKPASTTGLLPNSPFVNDLWSRRTINAARFTSNHGLMAQMLDWNTYFSQNPTTSPIIPAVKPATNNGNGTSPQVIVPEPSSIMLALGLTGFGIWTYRKRSK